MANAVANFRGTSKLGLTQTARGWVKWLNGRTRWIASYGNAPTAQDADTAFSERFGELIEAPASIDAVTIGYALARLLEAKKPTLSYYGLLDWSSKVGKFEAFVGSTRTLRSIGPEDFTRYMTTLAGKSISHRMKCVGLVRSAFRWWAAQGWCSEPRYGPVFVGPTEREKRIAKARRLPKMFTPEQIRLMLARADPPLLAAIYLGINGALGPADIQRLRPDQLAGAILTCPREKTGVERIVPLWPETLKAIADAGGLPLRVDVRIFNLFLKGCGVPQHGFYSLRRTFATVADECPDFAAVSMILGHADAGIRGTYRQHLSPSRLVAVSDHVRLWLAQ
jgi:integrase